MGRQSLARSVAIPNVEMCVFCEHWEWLPFNRTSLSSGSYYDGVDLIISWSTLGTLTVLTSPYRPVPGLYVRFAYCSFVRHYLHFRYTNPAVCDHKIRYIWGVESVTILKSVYKFVSGFQTTKAGRCCPQKVHYCVFRCSADRASQYSLSSWPT